MKSKFFSIIVVVAFVSLSGYGVYKNQQKNVLSDVMLANLEALADIEGGKCPDPYDVYDHQLSFNQKRGTFTVDGNFEINIMGKKFKIWGGSVGSTVTVTYEIGNCDKYSPGNCCPNSRNGEINIIGF